MFKSLIAAFALSMVVGGLAGTSPVAVSDKKACCTTCACCKTCTGPATCCCGGVCCK